MLKVGIVADPARKTNGKALADMLFARSPLYRYSAQYCRKNYNKFYVLSTKYGLIDPYKTIESYSLRLDQMTLEEVINWKAKVIIQILEEIPTDAELYFHAGKSYRKQIVDLAEKDYKVFEPMKNLGIGQQLQFYRADLGFDKEVQK